MGSFLSGQKHFSHGSLVGIFEGQLTQKYDILKQLGIGRQGKTLLVRGKSESKNLFVAKESHEKDPAAIADLRKEFDYLKCLQHPNISKVVELVLGKELEAGQWTDRLYVISELAAGSDLLHYIKNMCEHQCTLREDWMAKVLHQIMGGVAYLHSQRVVHNDLKPDNILCIQEFQPESPHLVPWVTVTDFGCAKVQDDIEFVCGDPRYQSPETLRALIAHLKGNATASLDREIGFAADIWSLGVTLFELLSGGVIPFIYEAVHNVSEVTHDPKRWETLKREVMNEDVHIDPYLGARNLVLKMLSKDWKDRPTALEILEDKWFTSKSHQSLSDENLARLELKKTKGMAHTLLLNAMAMKLQRGHYEESWKVFQQIDVDNDGSLSLAEFQKAFELLATSPTSSSLCKSPQGKEDSQGEWLAHIFKMADIDSNGLLNFPEFVAVTFDWSTLEKPVLDNILRRLFNQLDRDGNGEVSVEELAEIFKGALSWSELEQVCARIDADNDGHVTVEELKTFLFESISDDDLSRLSASTSIGNWPAGRVTKKRRSVLDQIRTETFSRSFVECFAGTRTCLRGIEKSCEKKA
eukprot:symbB.v1.2.028327.t1/scaffold2995.1/size65713/2